MEIRGKINKCAWPNNRAWWKLFFHIMILRGHYNLYVDFFRIIKCAGWKISENLVSVQSLIRTCMLEKNPKINKRACTLIRKTRVSKSSSTQLFSRYISKTLINHHLQIRGCLIIISIFPPTYAERVKKNKTERLLQS